ncbi:hypothetical protein L2750_04720 [Shewanella submarina]|uniref:ATPase n=1 Tax=Shewanella submarina TaxID=2016376 RepID=A0ABV7GM15_9GAMM|nr:hypothetical protein [Shewanella submarina]MCL1036454.1 hypothetical protein [Shewanella submarina]
MKEEQESKYNFYFVFHSDSSAPTRHQESLERVEALISKEKIAHHREDHDGFSTINIQIDDYELAMKVKLAYDDNYYWRN